MDELLYDVDDLSCFKLDQERPSVDDHIAVLHIKIGCLQRAQFNGFGKRSPDLQRQVRRQLYRSSSFTGVPSLNFIGRPIRVIVSV